ncbi:Bacterial ph-like domain, partial [Globisporangium splendens]
MLKGLTSDLTGSADICRPLKSFESALGVQYLLPSETILFSLQSSKEEFTFTNHALLKIHGSSATTTRKLVTRFDYKRCMIDHVKFETAGRVDRDVEIKFSIGSESISIDIAKDEEVVVRDYYKALEILSRAQKKNERTWDLAKLALKHSSDALYLTEASGQTLTRQSEEALGWLQDVYERSHPQCYRDVILAAFQEIRTNSKMLS